MRTGASRLARATRYEPVPRARLARVRRWPLGRRPQTAFFSTGSCVYEDCRAAIRKLRAVARARADTRAADQRRSRARRSLRLRLRGRCWRTAEPAPALARPPAAQATCSRSAGSRPATPPRRSPAVAAQLRRRRGEVPPGTTGGGAARSEGGGMLTRRSLGEIGPFGRVFGPALAQPRHLRRRGNSPARRTRTARPPREAAAAAR